RETADAVILAGEAVLAHQVLIDALRAQSGIELVEDDLPPRFAQAGLSRPWHWRRRYWRRRRADRRPLGGGRFWRGGACGRGGRFCIRSARLGAGRFCFGLMELNIPGHRVPVQSRLFGYPPDRPIAPVE